MKLEWRRTSDGDSVYTDLGNDGRLIISQTRHHYWIVGWHLFDGRKLRSSLEATFRGRMFDLVEQAKAAVENWWNSTTTQGEKAGER